MTIGLHILGSVKSGSNIVDKVMLGFNFPSFMDFFSVLTENSERSPSFCQIENT